MSFVNNIVANDNIFSRLPSFSSFFISPRFYTYSIIPYIKCASFNQNIFTALYINAIAVLSIVWIFHKNISYGQVFTQNWMQAPCRRVLKRYTYQQNFFTVV